MGRPFHFALLLLLVAAEAAACQAAASRTIPLQRRAVAKAAKDATGTAKEVVLLRTKKAVAAADGGKDVQLPVTDDDTAATVLQDFEQTLNAYFAQLTFGGDQVIGMLVNTASTDLLVPSSLCQVCDASQILNVEAANLTSISCEDPMCWASKCSDFVLWDFGQYGLDGLKGSCGPHGGVCVASADGGMSNQCFLSYWWSPSDWAWGALMRAPAVTLAGLTVKDVPVSAVAHAGGDFYEAPQGGGILGLAPGTKSVEDCKGPSCVPPLLDLLMAQDKARAAADPAHKAMPDRFSLYGHPSSPVLILGDDASATGIYYDGELQYASVLQPETYAVAMRGLSFGDGGGGGGKGNATGTFEEGPDATAAVSSGTTGLLLSRKGFAAFQQHLQTHYCHIPYVCPSADNVVTDLEPDGDGGGGNNRRGRRSLRASAAGVDLAEPEDVAKHPNANTIFSHTRLILVDYDAATLAQFPSLTIELADGPKLTLAPDQYFERAKDTGDGHSYHYLAVRGPPPLGEFEEEGPSIYSLGERLLKHFYVQFDREGQRVGFAPALPSSQ